MGRINSFGNFLLHILFPARCVFCGKAMPAGTKLLCCKDCMKQLPYVKECCPICGYNTSFGSTVCFHCNKKHPPFEKHVSVFWYKNQVQRAILRYKFYRHPSYHTTFAQFMLMQIREPQVFDCITSVPLTPERLRSRGYDQTALLATYLSKATGIPYLPTMKRVKKGVPRARLNYIQRRQTIRGAFEILKDTSVRDKVVLLVDDVYTTGLTVQECSRVLLRAGAAKVFVLTIATTHFQN